jgi:hypothetical protein
VVPDAVNMSLGLGNTALVTVTISEFPSFTMISWQSRIERIVKLTFYIFTE